MDIEKLVNQSLELINKSKFQEALGILENIEKKDSKVFFLIGSIHLSLKNIDLSEKNLLLALEKNKNNFSIYNNLGIVSKAKGDNKSAKNYFIKAIEKRKILIHYVKLANYLFNRVILIMLKNI